MNKNWVAKAASWTAAALCVACVLFVGCSKEPPKDAVPPGGNPTDPAVRMRDRDYRAALGASERETRDAALRASKLADRMAKVAEVTKKSEDELMKMPEYRNLKSQLDAARAEVAAARAKTQALVRRRMTQSPKELSK